MLEYSERLIDTNYKIFQDKLNLEKIYIIAMYIIILVRNVNNYYRYYSISNRCRRKEMQPLSAKRLFPSFQVGVNYRLVIARTNTKAVSLIRIVKNCFAPLMTIPIVQERQICKIPITVASEFFPVLP